MKTLRESKPVTSYYEYQVQVPPLTTPAPSPRSKYQDIPEVESDSSSADEFEADRQSEDKVIVKNKQPKPQPAEPKAELKKSTFATPFSALLEDGLLEQALKNFPTFINEIKAFAQTITMPFTEDNYRAILVQFFQREMGHIQWPLNLNPSLTTFNSFCTEVDIWSKFTRYPNIRFKIFREVILPAYFFLTFGFNLSQRVALVALFEVFVSHREREDPNLVDKVSKLLSNKFLNYIPFTYGQTPVTEASPIPEKAITDLISSSSSASKDPAPVAAAPSTATNTAPEKVFIDLVSSSDEAPAPAPPAPLAPLAAAPIMAFGTVVTRRTVEKPAPIKINNLVAFNAVYNPAIYPQQNITSLNSVIDFPLTKTGIIRFKRAIWSYYASHPEQVDDDLRQKIEHFVPSYCRTKKVRTLNPILDANVVEGGEIESSSDSQDEKKRGMKRSYDQMATAAVAETL